MHDENSVVIQRDFFDSEYKFAGFIDMGFERDRNFVFGNPELTLEVTCLQSSRGGLKPITSFFVISSISP